MYNKVISFFSNISQNYIVNDTSELEYPAELIMANDPESFISEQYLMIANNIAKISKKTSSKTFLFTSAQAKDGKTTTLVNVAVGLATKFKKKVLLVDTDYRRPGLKRFFLNNESKDSEELLEMTTETDFENLFYLPVNNKFNLEFLSEEDINSNVRELKYEFDFVLFDTAPVLKVADAASLAPFVDRSVLIVRASQTSGELVNDTINSLNLSEDKLTTILVNHKTRVDLYSYFVNPHYRNNYYNRYYEPYHK